MTQFVNPATCDPTTGAFVPPQLSDRTEFTNDYNDKIISIGGSEQSTKEPILELLNSINIESEELNEKAQYFVETTVEFAKAKNAKGLELNIESK
jgi:hypothetical protein